MPLKTPSFWYDANAPASRLKAASLAPAGALYGLGHAIHQKYAPLPTDPGIPVICIGNLVAGGGGKTPASIAVMELIRREELFSNPCFLSRGYGGSMRGPIMIDPGLHTAEQVGDEPLLLARTAPAIVCARRDEGALFARTQGHDAIVMDDGLQNTSLKKNLSIVVIDGESGFGNGKMIPAGPLRTSIDKGLRRADAILMIGPDRRNALRDAPSAIPVLNARIAAGAHPEEGSRYLAFCGIARPEKFQRTLRESGFEIMEFFAFADHHPYSDKDLATLQNRALAVGARLITTAKDAARIPPAFLQAMQIAILPVTMEWVDQSDRILTEIMKSRAAPGMKA